MDEIIWLNKKTKICNLIKKISDYYGGDDIEWLREYAREVIKQGDQQGDLNLQVTLNCFLDLERQIDGNVILI